MTDCIIFRGYRQDNGVGYGERTVKGKRWLAHRYSYFETFGPIPIGLFVCHRCNNKGCINPDHLYLATNQQNLADAKRDGLLRNHNSEKTACPNCRSEFTRNKYGRYCKPCKVRLTKESRARTKLKKLAIDSAIMSEKGER